MMDTLDATGTVLGQFNGLAVTAVLGGVAIILALRTLVRPKGFPPGPRGMPIVGSIYSMTDDTDVMFAKWAKQYGDIFGFKAGERWFVVLNRAEVIKEAILKQGVEFASRPNFYSTEILTQGYKNIVFGAYSDTWKFHRKLGHTALRQFATGKRLNDLLHGVFPKFQLALMETDGRPVNPRVMITLVLYNMLSTMCFGERYDFNDPRLVSWQRLIDKTMETLGYGLAADFFAFARYVPTGGPRGIKRVTEEFIKVVRPQIERHKEHFNPDRMVDFIDLLLLAQKEAIDSGSPDVAKLTDTHLIHTVIDIFSAGINTSVQTLYWALALIVEHPEIQAKIRQEIDTVIGRDRYPVIEDRGSIPYTEATLYEVMRYSSFLPISVPHATLTDTTLRGYRIPKGAVVLINIHSMHYDPREWDDPESFKPEHFLDESGTVRQHPPSFLPFGAGRRSCLGEAVAKADLFIIFAWLLQNYTFSKPPGQEHKDLLTRRSGVPTIRVLNPYEIVINKRK